MNKLFTIFSKRLFFFLISTLFTSVLYAQSFSPTVSVSLSNIDCGLSSDVLIDVSQDQGETDIDASVFSSDLGSFLLSSLSSGDTIGNASIDFLNGISVQSDLIVDNTSSISTIVLSVDVSNGITLGQFTITNLSGGGVVVTAANNQSDGNNTTGGYSSNATFFNLFSNPNSGILNFTSNINSELAENDFQSFTFYLSCLDFSPIIDVVLSNNSCDSLADLTISVSQDAGEVDIDSALFTSDGGQFLIPSMSVGDIIGTAFITAGSNSYNTDLVVGVIVSSSQVIIEAIDNSGIILGTFNIENTISGVSVTATSPADGNTTTSGNSSTATFNNIFQNPNNGVLTFTSTSTSEVGSVDVQSSILLMTCADFSPSVSVSISNNWCDSLSDLTINVSQDANEVDIDTALFYSDGGSFTISSMNIADIVGTANMTYGGSTFNTNLSVSSVISSSQAIVEAIDISSGITLGTFLIENLSSGGINIVATSPADGNTITSGNTSSVTFHNIFQNPSDTLDFTSSITSELGGIDLQSFSFNMNCMTFSPNISVALLTLDCDSLNNLTINVSQDPYQVDMDTALFVSDGGEFTISSMSVGDTIGSASLTAGTNAFTTDLLVSSVVSSSQVIIESINVNSGLVLGTFIISNNLSGGVSITATSISDGNNITLTGNTSLVVFNNVFLNPTASTLNFVSTITSELGDVDIQTFSYVIVCQCVTQYTDVTVTACDDFLWDGVVYDSTNSYTNSYIDINGCDSVVTLNLTINDSYSGSLDVTVCDDFLWDGVVYDSTGSYNNSYIDINGCDSIVTLNLTINESPDVQITFTNGDLSADATGGTSPYQYLWNTSETSQIITPANNGTYWCVVTDDEGCTADTAVYIVTTVSVIDFDEADFIVYPNPVSSELNIEFNIIGITNVELKIVNILGEIMYSENIDNTSIKYSNKLDFTNYSHGIYFVKLKLDTKLITSKVIVQ